MRETKTEQNALAAPPERPVQGVKLAGILHSPSAAWVTGGFGAWARRVLPLALLVGLIIFFSIFATNFATTANFFNILRSASTLMVIAAGATLVVVAGSVDLSVGAVAALAGTVVAVQLQSHGDIVLLLALPIGLACGLINGVLLAYALLPSFLVTLGTMFIFDGYATKLTNGAPESISSQSLNSLVNQSSVLSVPNIVYWAIIALLAVSFLAYRTSWGRHIYAIGGNERVAKLSGLPVKRDKVLMFLLSGGMAGIAGLMLDAQGGGSSPGMGDQYLLYSIAAIVMGGTALSGGAGGPARTIVGVLTIAVVSNGMTLLQVDPNLQNVVFGLIVLFAVAFTVRRSELDAVKLPQPQRSS
jgi:ribose transport system permease protein